MHFLKTGTFWAEMFFFVVKNPDPDRYFTEILDPDSMNMDSRHCNEEPAYYEPLKFVDLRSVDCSRKKQTWRSNRAEQSS
jgi:hypothetical protein